MGIRDKEIERIRLYCRGLGIRLTIKDYPWDDSAEWSNEPKHIINVNKRRNVTKTQLILTLLHEIAHAIFHIHTGIEIPDASILPEPVSKKERKKLYEFEKDSLAYMPIIYKELSLKIPEWKVNVAKEIDAWFYEYYYLNGKYPSKKEAKAELNAIEAKYKLTKESI